MARKKTDTKVDMQVIVEKYRPMMRKFAAELGTAAKKGEETVIQMSKILKIQMEILAGTLQKEKIYHEIGKKVAEELLKGRSEFPGLGKYKKLLEKIDVEGKKKKQAISRVKKQGTKKAVKKIKK